MNIYIQHIIIPIAFIIFGIYCLISIPNEIKKLRNLPQNLQFNRLIYIRMQQACVIIGIIFFIIDILYFSIARLQL